MTKAELLSNLAEVPEDVELRVVLQMDDAEEGDVLVITDVGYGDAGHVLYVQPVSLDEDDEDKV